MAQPFVHALNRMRLRETLRPDQLEARAEALLEERLGTGAEVRTAFGRGVVGLLSEHTHYFDGFGLLLPLSQSTAVALRPVSGDVSSVVFEEDRPVHRFAAGEASKATGPLRVVAEALRGAPSAFEVSVVSTVPTAFREAAETALAFALVCAFNPEASRSERIRGAGALLSTEGPFSAAYPIVAGAGKPGTVALVDTRTLEHLPLDVPIETVGWGLVAPVGPEPGAGRSCVLKRRADRALAYLQKNGVEISSFRELEHRDLPRALEAAVPLHRPTIHHLVTENRRVQNFVAAIRRGDLQMAGALLLMSYNARRDWEGVSPEEREAVRLVESMTTDGIYGATLAGHSRTLLVLGRPFLVPAALDRVCSCVEEATGRTPEAMLL